MSNERSAQNGQSNTEEESFIRGCWEANKKGVKVMGAAALVVFSALEVAAIAGGFDKKLIPSERNLEGRAVYAAELGVKYGLAAETVAGAIIMGCTGSFFTSAGSSGSSRDRVENQDAVSLENTNHVAALQGRDQGGDRTR
jgi:hypothetical protein